ncbi:MAG: YadA-like family protein, partial [Dialister invisus]|nr:YadA-like family protein [Dialister invisus]
GQRGLALGNYLTVKGEEAVAVGTNASATADWAIAMGKNSKAEKETAMAFGYDSHAKVSGGVALGSWSVVDTAAGVSGYDPSTKAASTDTSAAWKSTVGAVSVGDASKGITRQITGVAAGAADTDAVNVAQLKKVEATAAAAKTNVTAGDNVTVTHDSTTNTYKVSAKDTYTTGGTYDAATKKIKFTQNDPSKNYEVDVSGLVGSGGTGSLTFAGDTGSAITKNSGETLQITGGATEVAAANNIGVVSENGKLNLKLAKNIDLGSDGSIKTGDTKMDNKGLAIQGGPSVTKGGIDAGSKKITHVAAGEISATSTDAVNGSQLQAVKNDVQNNTQNIYNMGKKVGELGTRINKVGAGAAALAALHPLDFDPHDKWDIAAGFGNYRNASAAAVGLFYRPNERTMMSLGWTMGDDRNMINAGISVKLGRGDVYTRYSKVEMANQIKDLKEKNDKMQAENKEMRSELDELKAQVAALAAKK